LPNLQLLWSGSLSGISRNRIVKICRIPKGDYLVASEVNMFTSSPNFHRGAYISLGVKSVYEKNANEFLCSSHWGLGSFNTNNLRMDTLWRERSTALFYRRDTTFIGTLNGLFFMTGKGVVSSYRKDVNFFRKRISAIAESYDSILWVATYNEGIVGYKDGRIVTTLTKQTGLTSNIIRTMLTHGMDLWAGTDKGLNCIRLDQPGWPVTQYTSQDGLGSDMVNCICADGNTIYVGTPAGLSYFDETKVNLSEDCRLYLLSIFNSGKERIDDSARLTFPFTDKHIRLEFAGISYRSVGGVTYDYRMLGT
jgi:hypothetical protein